MTETIRPAESNGYCPNCGSTLKRWGEGRKLCFDCAPEFQRTVASYPPEGEASTATNGGRAASKSSAREPRADEGSGSSTSPLLPPTSDVVPDVTFVLPTMNEEEGIRTCIDWAVTALRELGMTGEVIVSDSSTDETPEIAKDLGALVVKPNQLGYGYAYRYGFQFARGEYIVMGDADCTYDFRALPRLLRPIREGDADIVMGSRFEGEIEPGAMPKLHQYVGNPLLTRFLNVFYGAGISDAHSGFRVFTRDALERLNLRSPGMEFASEMVMDATTAGLTIAEVPIDYHARKGEETLDSLRDGWRHVKFMITNVPAYVYAVPGSLVALIGVFLMGLSFFGLQPGLVTFGTHTVILGSLALIVGFQIWLLAPFSTIAGDPIRRSNDPLTRWIESKFRLEYGMTAGGLLTVLGAAYGSHLLLRWLASGYEALPFVPADMLAFTAVVLGIEMVFVSLCLSSLADAASGA